MYILKFRLNPMLKIKIDIPNKSFIIGSVNKFTVQF